MKVHFDNTMPLHWAEIREQGIFVSAKWHLYKYIGQTENNEVYYFKNIKNKTVIIKTASEIGMAFNDFERAKFRPAVITGGYNNAPTNL